jgi:hypothetical protein
MCSKKEEPPPFLQTDAGHIEALTQAFDVRMTSSFRSWGQEFLEGKEGESAGKVGNREDLFQVAMVE